MNDDYYIKAQNFLVYENIGGELMKIKTKIKLDKQTMGLFLLLLPHYKPDSLEYIAPHIESLFDIGRLLSVLIVFVTYFKKKRKLSKETLMFAMLSIWIFIVTIIKQSDNPNLIYNACLKYAAVMTILMLSDYYLKINPRKMLDAMLLLFEFLVYINLITVILFYPRGMYVTESQAENYFLGLDNKFITYLLPAVVVALIHYFNSSRKSLRPILLIAAAILQTAIVWAATSLVAFVILIAILFFGKFKSKSKMLDSFVVGISLIIVDILVVIIRFYEKVKPIRYIITEVLHKQLTLSNRIYVWDSFMVLFRKSPVIGYGYGEEVKSIVSGGSFAHAHNQYYQYLLYGGVIALFIFAVINVLTWIKLNKNKGNMVFVSILGGFAAMYFFFITEAFAHDGYILLFPLAWHIGDIQKIRFWNK